MSESSSALSCPGCGKRLKWTPQLAERKVKCPSCSQVMRLPASPQGAIEALGQPAHASARATGHEPATYEVADDSATGADRHAAMSPRPGIVTARCPACNAKLARGAVVCVNCGYHVAEGKRLSTEVAAPAPPSAAASAVVASSTLAGLGAYVTTLSQESMRLSDVAEDERRRRRLDYMIPLALIVAGLVGILFNSLTLDTLAQNVRKDRAYQYQQRLVQALGQPVPSPPSHSIDPVRLAFVLIYACVRLIIQFPLMLLAIFLVARWFGSSFGTVGVGLLKLLALALFTDMVNDAVYLGLDILTGGYAWVGGTFSFCVNITVFVLLCVWMFQMEVLEAFVMWLVMFLLPILLMLFLLTTVMATFA